MSHFKLAQIAVAASCAVLALPSAQARITKIEITASESPTFGGYSWPGVGQYQKIAGKAYGEVNPADPKNALIVDINLAPKMRAAMSSTRSTSTSSNPSISPRARTR